MSRRNPTKRQRKIIFNLMKSGMSYEMAAMTLPESQPDNRAWKDGIPHPELTNIPKLLKKKDHGEGVYTQKEA